jgi:hypothetical protein
MTSAEGGGESPPDKSRHSVQSLTLALLVMSTILACVHLPAITSLQPAHLMPLLGATGCKIYRTEQNVIDVEMSIRLGLTDSIRGTHHAWHPVHGTVPSCCPGRLVWHMWRGGRLSYSAIGHIMSQASTTSDTSG